MKMITRDLDKLALVMVCDGMHRLCLREMRDDTFAELLFMYVRKQLVSQRRDRRGSRIAVVSCAVEASPVEAARLQEAAWQQWPRC